MRIIFVLIGLLILGNLVAFMLPPDVEKTNRSFSSKTELSPEKIILLQSVGDSAKLDSSTGDSSTGSIDENESIAASHNIDGKCYRIGPFLHASRLSLAKAQLNNADVIYTVNKRESAAAEVFRVYMGAYASSDLAKAARQLLNDKDIFDHFQRKETDGSYVVSLGIYSRSISAQASKERFEAKDLDVKIRPEKTVLPDSFWLNLLAKESQPLPHDVLKKIDWGEYSAQFGSYECQS